MGLKKTFKPAWLLLHLVYIFRAFAAMPHLLLKGEAVHRTKLDQVEEYHRDFLASTTKGAYEFRSEFLEGEKVHPLKFLDRFGQK